MVKADDENTEIKFGNNSHLSTEKVVGLVDLLELKMKPREERFNAMQKIETIYPLVEEHLRNFFV